MTSKNRISLVSFLSTVLLAASNFGCSSAPPPPISVSISPSTAQSVDQGQTVNFTANVVNDSSNKGVAWTVSCSAAPCGTVLPAATASGAPTTYTAPSAVAANLTVTVTATSVADSTKSAPGSAMAVPPPSVAGASLADGMVNTAYSQTLQAAGGSAPYTWSVAAGSSLPAGLSLNCNGTVSGTPSASGTSSFSVQVADSGKPPLVSSPASVSMSVATGPLAVTTTSLPNLVAGRNICTSFIIGQPCGLFLAATGGLGPYTWSIAAGALPPGVLLDSRGAIDGAATTPGTFNFTVQVTDSEVQPMTAPQPLSITVTSPLNGRYAFLFQGFDNATGKQTAAAGSFDADDAGNITSGVEDLNGPGGPVLNVPFTGTYTFDGDERGTFTIITASGTKTYAFAFGSFDNNGVATKGRFIEFDDKTGTTGQRGSGIIRLQDATAFSQGNITGPYAFGFAGQNAAGGRFAEAGIFTADGAGNLKNGLEDMNDAGTMTNNASFTGSYTAPDATTGRASVTTTAAAGATHLSAYVVSASELLLMSTDAESSSGLRSGEALSQVSTAMPFSNGSLNGGAIFYEVGVNSAAPTTQSSVAIGRFSADGIGGLSVEFDQNDGGTITADQTVTGLTYSVASSGRVSITGGSGSQPIVYLVDANKGFYLDTGASAGFGFLEPQSLPANPFSGCTAVSSISVLGHFSSQIAYGSCFFGVAPPGVTTSSASSGEVRVTHASVGIFLRGITTDYQVLDSSSSNGTLTSGTNVVLASFAAPAVLPVSSTGRITAASNAIGYVISPGNFVLIDETATDTAPVVTIAEE